MGWTVALTNLFKIPVFAAALVLLERLGTSVLMSLASLYTWCESWRTAPYREAPCYARSTSSRLTVSRSRPARQRRFIFLTANSSLAGTEGRTLPVLGLAFVVFASDSFVPRAFDRLSAGIVATGSTVFAGSATAFVDWHDLTASTRKGLDNVYVLVFNITFFVKDDDRP